ncbi:MAG: hypothetical protein UX07_C0002G0028 [Parcubacteria group bacterium GW2011_GWA2_45_30]|nr:MAG: hypothetical protein UX07_C0002G0028 [Parcubacteria group bacterium GW2011_GWA2_45_30]
MIVCYAFLSIFKERHKNMKLEIIALGTCEICGNQFSSSDVMEVQKKTKECEDQGAYCFGHNVGDVVTLEVHGVVFRVQIVSRAIQKETHAPTYYLETIPGNSAHGSPFYGEYSAQVIDNIVVRA